MSTIQLSDVPGTVMPSGARMHRATRRETLQRRTAFQSIGVMWRVWRERRAAQHALASLSAHILRDIGVTPEFVDYELWRSARRARLDGRAVRCLYGGDVPSGDRRSGPESIREEFYRGPGR